jgi:hypothetical protein
MGRIAADVIDDTVKMKEHIWTVDTPTTRLFIENAETATTHSSTRWLATINLMSLVILAVAGLLQCVKVFVEHILQVVILIMMKGTIATTIMWLDLHAIVIDVSVTVVMTDTQTTVLPAARLPAPSAESHLMNRLWGLWA